MCAASHNQLKCELQFLCLFQTGDTSRSQSYGPRSTVWPLLRLHLRPMVAMPGRECGCPARLSLHLLCGCYTFISWSLHFFCRIITRLQGTSQPISVIENWLTFCPGQYHQGCSGTPDNKTLLPPLNQMHSLLLA